MLGPQGLSRRETQVLDLVASGMTNIEVASQLGIGVHAVKFHLASIYRKLEVGNRTQATSLYLRSGAAAGSVGGPGEARGAEGTA